VSSTPTHQPRPAQRRGPAQQSRRVEEGLPAQRRQQAVRAIAVILVALVVTGGAAVYFFRPATPALGHQVPIESNRQHVAQGADMAYRNRPPSSGDHYPTPAGYGAFSRKIALGNLVHTLEHSGIVVYYRPDLCDQGCQYREHVDRGPEDAL
jgi:uncharacterized protein DUF3105